MSLKHYTFVLTLMGDVQMGALNVLLGVFYTK